MKRKEIKDLHTKEVAELKKMLAEAKESLFSLKIELTQFKLKNTSSLTQKRRDIAVLLTVLNGKELKNGKNA